MCRAAYQTRTIPSLALQHRQQARHQLRLLPRGVEAPRRKHGLERHHHRLLQPRRRARQPCLAHLGRLCLHLRRQQVGLRLPRVALLAVALPLDEPLLRAVDAAVLDQVVSLRQRDMSSRSGRRYAGRQGGGTLGGPRTARREARGARVRTASRKYCTNYGCTCNSLRRPGRPRIDCRSLLVRATHHLPCSSVCCE